MSKNSLRRANGLIKECLRLNKRILDLGNCGITNLENIPMLFECHNIETLILSSSWTDRQTKETWESDNQANQNRIHEIPEEITRLRSLKKIVANNISVSRIKISGETGEKVLPNLNFIDISCNNIRDTSWLKGLDNIEYLDISSNKISKLNSIKRLANLKYLSASHNNISLIENLENLRNLEYLDLHSNKIKLLEGISNQQYLKTLLISNNEIEEIKGLENLSSINKIVLNSNKIKKIQGLSSLDNLKFLHLSNNQISQIENLEELNKLEYLDLRSNKISKIEGFSNLINLNHLFLSNNQISIIDGIDNNTRLQILDLKSNNIRNVPLSIVSSKMDVFVSNAGNRGIELFENPIEAPPIEIVKQGKEAIIYWYNAHKQKLNEIKIILIGDPKAGKTSLFRRLYEDSFNSNEPQTDGITIEDINFGKSETFLMQKSLHRYLGHFWDFGGQEVLSSTHQFFLTNRSVYILVLDARKDSGLSDQIRVWLKRIEASGGKSPILVLANQVDVNSGFGFENEYELIQEFPQIKSFIKISCLSGLNIDSVKNSLEEVIPSADLLNTEIDVRWLKIKEVLQRETKQQHFIDESRFIEICNNFGLKDKGEQKSAIRFFNDLGLILHFEELNLSEYYVLDPYWITFGVYQILTSTLAGTNNGLVPMSMLDYIINDEEDKRDAYHPKSYSKIHYSHNQRRFLVDILNHFKLCFYMPEGKSFIIPDLLDTNEPKERSEPIRRSKDSINFVYKYDFLSKSIVPRIMVQTHRLITSFWRTGCLLSTKTCEALITSYQNKIKITVIGFHKEKRDFMSFIRYNIDIINNELKLKPIMLIPLPGTANLFADYDELIDRELDGEKNYIVYRPEKKVFEISKLLEGISTKNEVSIILSKLDQLIQNTEDIKDEQKQIEQKNEAYFEHITTRIQVDLQEFKLAIKEINEEQSVDIIDQLTLLLGDFQDDLEYDIQEMLKNLKNTKDWQVKLKLLIPLMSIVRLEGEVDIQKIMERLYEKYKLRIFKVMGWV